MKISASQGTPELHLLSASPFTMKNPNASKVTAQQVWALEWVAAGQLQVEVEAGDWHILHAGRGILYAPGTRYRERVATAGDICRSNALFFELSTLPPTWSRFATPYLLICDEEKILAPLVERIVRHLGLGVVDDLQATASFLEIMGHLLRAEQLEHTLRVMHEYSSASDLTARTHRFMRSHLADPLPLPIIATALGLSTSGFAHAYKRETGQSPMTALRQMRVEAVKAHLLRDRLTLAQIADETGFADAFHLSRIFKQMVGVSPRQFRRRL